jgi:hypothetical protein
MSNVKDTLDAVQGLVEAVPVYEDMLQPASKELGKGLLTISKTVNMALAPLSVLVWGYEKIAQYLETSMAEKLKDVPEDKIITPDPSIAVPTIEALRYTSHIEDIREMFSNLIATAMNQNVAVNAHPSFVEIIKQLSPLDAQVFQFLMANKNSVGSCRIYLKIGDRTSKTVVENFIPIPNLTEANLEFYSASLDNLLRLGLISIDHNSKFENTEIYESIYNHSLFLKFKNDLTKAKHKHEKVSLEINHSLLSITSFGMLFNKSCM